MTKEPETAYELVCRRLLEVTGRPVHNGMAHCPRHDDHKPSLSVTNGERGAVVHCFAGCDVNAICDALGIPLSALFDNPSGGSHQTTWIDGEWVYTDELGAPLFRVQKLMPAKAFPQSRSDGRGGWIGGKGAMKGVRRVPYRLPQLLEAVKSGRTIFIAEGEKDCDALIRAGEVATCNPEGAEKWRDEYSRYFAGAPLVIVIADKDNPGYRHARHVAESLRPHVGVVETVLAKSGKDAAEHLAAGHTVEEFERIDRQLDVLCGDAVAGRASDRSRPTSFSPVLERGLNGYDLTSTIRLSDVSPRRVEWLWKGRLPKGKLVVLDGDPGAGKATLLTDLAARISTGSPMPDGERLQGPANVILLSAEDGLEDTIRPRVDAGGGDPSRVVFLEGIRCPIDEKNTDECYIRPPSLPIDVAALRDLIRREHAALAVVDVLNAYLSNRVDGHKDQDIRTALAPLAKLAEETGCCIVVVRHLNKSGGGNPLYRGGGSIGIIGAARVGLLAATDPDDSERSVLAVTKCNVAELAPALAYRLLCDEENGCARVQWEGVTRHQAEDLLSTRADEDNDTLDAKDVLHLILADHAGAMPMNEAVAAMAEAGFSKDQARRAKERLGARSLKVGKPGDPEQAWYWVLPGCEGGTKKSQGGEDGGSPEPAPFASFVPPSAGATTAARSLDSVEEDF